MIRLFLGLFVIALTGCTSLPDLSKEQPFAPYIGKTVVLVDDQIVVQVPAEMSSGVVPRWLVSVAEFEHTKDKWVKLALVKSGERIKLVRLVRRPIQNDLFPGSVLYAICEVPGPDGPISCEMIWGASGALVRAPWEPKDTPENRSFRD